jgi:hypothetical protein
MVINMQVGDKYKWYDGGGFLGTWNIEIVDIDGDMVTYRMTNNSYKPPKIEQNTESCEKVEHYINRGDEWAWEKL